ncbi:GNAT family protein [Aquabacterium sp.]|uniref:GNAT family N-acetyltransferase n=1 Tax=Aquabacterium sp. TaxID=1872578 RepID=UPI002E30E1E1|nr:GNAT family protein [Aquabacterium sp.]HEX5310800.1 GNAT family protein [Aquabacterium sp.]
MKIEKFTLEGHRVRLEPLEQHHLSGLRLAIEDGKLWEIPVTFVPHPDNLPSFLDAAETAFRAGTELAFATVDRHLGKVVGSTRFRCIEATHRRLEIGFTFLAASSQRTHVNTEAKYLMLSHAFETLACNRVELLTDERNTKSRNAIQRIGAKEEGVLRSHMVMREGFLRNSVMFSIIATEWPSIKANLHAKICVA